MSDRLYPLSISRLLRWILQELDQDTVFGVSRELFFAPQPDDPFRLHRYGCLLETPLGVAAGPHTQMAQNIVLAWLMGARYIELKTVQTLDDLDVSKPCIDMEDEGYNCEWSQELRLQQSFEEYLKAWVLIHVLRDRFGWGKDGELGCIFNISVGYDLSGIRQPNVQHFLDQMENCQVELERIKEDISPLYPRVKDLAIPSRISDNVTLSTMHGCPPDEIERIARYLLEERGYHTTIKLNPTLLGPERLRDILYNRLGYTEVVVPDEAFEHDLEYSVAVGLIERMQEVAKKSGVQFGLKLTNTLEVENHKAIFPEKEKRMYLSGRALHPISVNLAARLQRDFNGQLDISFCAGVDAFNVTDILAADLSPITVCTDLLKPGGYTRLTQYLEFIREKMAQAKANSIAAYIVAQAGKNQDISQSALANLERYADEVLSKAAYQKGHRYFESIKTERSLTPFDCVHAPCIGACATDQDIPAYLYHVANGDFDQARQVILQTNPLPGITGYVCDHLCQLKCTRNNMDDSLLIREIKRFVMEHSDPEELKPDPSNGLRVAIIGGGPAGLSCAFFLALRGFKVDLYEMKSFAGGMVSQAIPKFRMPVSPIEQDIHRIQALGVRFHLGIEVNRTLFERLREECDYLYLALGAQRNRALEIPGEDLPHVLEPLELLSRLRQGQDVKIGKRVAVIGGGNTALDAARSARRLGSEVSILYRRSRREMPADGEEIEAALEEGIRLVELVAPKGIEPAPGGSAVLTCSRMALGEKDASGRPRPVEIEGKELHWVFDTIIPAVGQEVAIDFLSAEDLTVDPTTGETRLKNVFAGGDLVRGASSVIHAVGDGRKVAYQIMHKARLDALPIDYNHGLRLPKEDYQKKLARRIFTRADPVLPLSQRSSAELVSRTLTVKEARLEALRCLLCDDVCDICVSVCPNLANISYRAQPRDYPVYSVSKMDAGFHVQRTGTLRLTQPVQVLNIADFCNECGNCTTFCPTAGEPYRDKPRFFLTRESFEQDDKGYFLDGETLEYKANRFYTALTKKGTEYHFNTAKCAVVFGVEKIDIKEVRFLDSDQTVDLSMAAEMILLLENLMTVPFFEQ